MPTSETPTCRILPLSRYSLMVPRISSVQVVERDAVRSQPAKALLDLSSECLGAALPRSVSAFRRDDASVRDGRVSSADRLFAFSSGVCVGAVDVAHSGGDGLFHEGDVLTCVRESIRPEADPGYLGVTKLQLRRAVHGPHAPPRSRSVASVLSSSATMSREISANLGRHVRGRSTARHPLRLDGLLPSVCEVSAEA
jgi:hypothetical protein